VRNALVLDLADCTEFRQSLQARPPRIVHGTALLLAALVATALTWGALTRADLVVRGSGRVRPVDSTYKVVNPVRGETLSVSAGGRVVEVNFHEGDEVKRGDVLIRFDTERLNNDIVRQEQKLRLAQEELAKTVLIEDLMTRQFAAAKAKATAEQEQARESVRRAKERQAAEAYEVRAELANAREDEARLSRLAATQAVAKADLNQAVTKRQVLERRLEKAEVPVEEGQLETARQALALLERDHALRREELALKNAAKQAEVDAAKIELANLELQRQQSVVRAPVDGIVAAGEVKVGDVLEPGKALLEIAEQKGFVFEALIPSDEIGLLKEGMTARLKLDAFDFQKYGALEGTVRFISPDSGVAQGPASGAPGAGVDATRGGPQTPFYVVKIAIDREEFGRGDVTARIKLGMAGRVEIVTEQESLLSILVRKVRRSISLG
jgi:multidrug efflux pump subunit AcrA (membrane-fusion protein)